MTINSAFTREGFVNGGNVLKIIGPYADVGGNVLGW